MNDSNLTRLKVIVERAVRPVRASTYRKRKMREELLAHVSAVFEEESARLGDDSAALERTALRFGNPAEVTAQLQESIPARDRMMRLWEGRPGESTLRSALRFAWIEVTLCLLFCGVAMFAAGRQGPWSREELIAFVSSSSFLPFWLFAPVWFFGTAFVAHLMEKSLPGHEPPPGWPGIGLRQAITSAWAVTTVRIAMISGALCLTVLLLVGGATWPRGPWDWNHWTIVPTVILYAGFCMASSVCCAWCLVQTVAGRRRYYEEWASLPMES